ncbi:hypothetical protein EVAR_6079_1 [Eumeta japonica]|uniref:Uncharacterized protein n=1 Tax=Eumeta variegata TaxID=151549 RepID=A0A4C1TF24_EUMVA|nr:hypothetical protein EVAR_6079_1 [Eumeta japonica]
MGRGTESRASTESEIENKTGVKIECGIGIRIESLNGIEMQKIKELIFEFQSGQAGSFEENKEADYVAVVEVDVPLKKRVRLVIGPVYAVIALVTTAVSSLQTTKGRVLEVEAFSIRNSKKVRKVCLSSGVKKILQK